MLSKSHTPLKRLSYWGYQSIRCGHWYWDGGKIGGPRDSNEDEGIDGSPAPPEFGEDEIRDKDRHPHVYWRIWKGRTSIQRVIAQWGYSKDLKPEKIARDAEKLRYFTKLDQLNFLEYDRSMYSYLPHDADGAVGYISEDEDDELTTHVEYGKTYAEASPEYREMVLTDACSGRPVYEWQVPYGLDEAYGYKDVSTAVDVLGNKEALENLECKFTVGGGTDGKGTGVTLTNKETKQTVLICEQKDVTASISAWKPDTVVFQHGAEQLLHSLKRTYTPTSFTDVNGCAIALAWSGLFYMSPLFPEHSGAALLATLGLAALNGTFVFNTFTHNNEMKKAMAECRNVECNVVLGDWLRDDVDERLSQVKPFDDYAEKLLTPVTETQTILDTGASAQTIVLGQGDDTPALQFMKSLPEKYQQLYNKYAGDDKPKIGTDEALRSDWMRSYSDAVNSRRIDLLAQISNNVAGDKVIVCVRDIDNIPASVVSQMLQRRLTGQLPLQSSVFEYDEFYERVAVVF